MEGRSRDQCFHPRAGCAQLAAEALGSASSRFYFDHLRIKEPETAAPTPWHQDVPYWPFMGQQICSAWFALTDCSVKNSSLEFVCGSHRDGKYYAHRGRSTGRMTAVLPGCAQRQAKNVPISRPTGRISISLDSIWRRTTRKFSRYGSCLARVATHLPKHAALPVSTRWLGDEFVWFPHDGTDPTVKAEDVSGAPGDAPTNDTFFA